MKTLSKILVLALFLSPFLGQAQFVPKKTKVEKPSNISTKVSIKNNIPTLKKADLKTLQSSKVDLSKKASPLKVDKALLTLPSRKKYHITPKNPYDNGLSFSFFGNYSPEAFTVGPRLSGQTSNAYSRNQYYTYSGFIVFNARAGKEYRVKIELKDVRGSGKITIDNQVSSVSNSNRTINYVFSSVSNGQYVIALSPYERNGAINPEDFKITSVQIDELE